MSISARIYILIIFIALLIGGSSAYFAGEITEGSLRKELNERGDYITDTLVEVYTDSIANNNILPVIESIQSIVKEHPDLSYIYFTGFDGRLIAHSFEAGFPEQLLAAWSDIPKETTQIYLADSGTKENYLEQRRPLIDGLPSNVHLGLSLSFMEKSVYEVYKYILLSTLSVVLFGIIIGAYFSRRFTDPLSQLVSNIYRFGRSEDVSINDLPTQTGGREIIELSHAFRAMIEERAENEARQNLSTKVFNNTNEAIFITDAEGSILSANRAFCEISGYIEEDVIGENPRIMKSGYQDAFFYKELWSALLDRGYWQGELWNRRKNGEVFPAWQTISAVYDHNKEIINYISIFSDVSKEKYNEKRIAHLAYHDPLTDLPNRLLFNERIEQTLIRSRRHDKRFAVLFIDLDNFKSINDSLGHPTGDGLLKEIASRLRNCVREEDTIARLGGDEFVILVDELSDDRDASLVASNVLAALSPPASIDGNELRTTASIGISLYPSNGSDVLSLMKNADAAMYRAKETGRNNYQYYAPELTMAAFDRLILEGQLRQALERNELKLFYQPQIALNHENEIKVEALLRWENPESGMVSPAKFIPIAESTGLILPIGEWVIKTACRQLKEWRRSDIPVKCISVNISGVQILRDDLLATIKSSLDENDLSAECLEVEITETAIMEDLTQVTHVLKGLEKLGVKLAIDDFGTGYSSLSYLKQMPLHRLKIDQSFVRDVPGDDDDENIIRAIIGLAQNLRLELVAEGVETIEQQDFLKSHGCNVMQGYLYSRPLPADEVTEWLNKRSDQAASQS